MHFGKAQKAVDSGIDRPGIPRWKRCLDLALIVLSLPLWLPLMAAISLAIKLNSRGPILFCQERIGFDGRPFDCLKFRTMIVGADTSIHQNHLASLIGSERPMTKMDLKGDPRLIVGGAWLRSSGLDELPQLINVLLGEMSIVGPRPCLPYEFERYSDFEKQRFSGLPGLTGLWQVSGKNKTTFTEMINLDISYLKNKSLILDLKIIVKTIPALISQINEVRTNNNNSLKQKELSAGRACYEKST